MSPERAARRAERAAKQAKQRGREKRRMWLAIGGIAVVSIGLTVADYFWLRYQARQRREQHERLHQRHKLGTNNPTLQTNQTGVSLPERKQ